MTTLRSTGGTVGVLAASLLAAGCGEGTDPPEPEAAEAAVDVEVWTVRTETVQERRQWSGRLEPLRALTVRAPRRGRVASLEVRDGDRVQQGDVLARLHAPDLEARRGVLEERLEHLEEELTRWRRLAEAEAAGPGEVSDAVLRVLEVRELLAEVEADLQGYVLRAPGSGQVAGTAVGVGSEVEAGEPVVRVDDAASQGVRITVPAQEASLLERADRLSVRDELGNPLEVDRVVYSPDEHPGFAQAELFLTGGVNGRVGQVDVAYEAAEEVLIVPWTSVASDAEGHWVAVVAGEPGRVERRFLELGRAHPDGIEVRHGLEAGERVIRYEPRAHPEGGVVRPMEPGG